MMRRAVILSLILLFGASRYSYADWRSYVWTYEYMSMRKGTKEVENYITTAIPGRNRSNINTWRYWLEMEYGITDRLDIGIYQMFKYSNKDSESDFKYDGFKIRTRYRIGEKGRFIVDPLVYLEYAREGDFSEPDVIEGKLILAKDAAGFNFAYNLILKQELETRGRTEHEYAAGIHYRLMPSFKCGIESKGNYSQGEYYLGPTVSVAGKKAWVALGVLSGLNDRSDDIRTRLIAGYAF